MILQTLIINDANISSFLMTSICIFHCVRVRAPFLGNESYFCTDAIFSYIMCSFSRKIAELKKIKMPDAEDLVLHNLTAFHGCFSVRSAQIGLHAPSSSELSFPSEKSHMRFFADAVLNREVYDESFINTNKTSCS